MIYTDTRDNEAKVDFKTAVMNGMNSRQADFTFPLNFLKPTFQK